MFVPWNFLNKLISTIWDSFHGGASPSYDLFFNVTDGQNANTELITLGVNCQYTARVYRDDDVWNLRWHNKI